MNVVYINPFIAGTRDVFDAMVKLPLSVGRPRLRDPQESSNRLYSVSVVIGLSGAVSGALILNLTQPVALALATALAGEGMTQLNADALDALAEIANMIAGSAKKRLPSGQVNITVPTLLKTLDVIYPNNMPIIALPLDAPMGRFTIEIAMKDLA